MSFGVIVFGYVNLKARHIDACFIYTNFLVLRQEELDHPTKEVVVFLEQKT